MMPTYRNGLRLCTNVQDFTIATAALDSVDALSSRTFGGWRYPINLSGLLATYPTITLPGTAHIERCLSRGAALGLRLCLLLVGGPTDNSVWRTLAGHAGSSLTQRDGTEWPSDERFQRMEAALYEPWLDGVDQVLGYVHENYDPNLIDIQFWNEPFQDDYPSAESTSGEFHIMANQLVPPLKTICQGYGFRLLGPSTAGLWGTGLTFENQIAYETIQFGETGIFKDWLLSNEAAQPTYFDQFDALTTHAPYVSGDAYPSRSPFDYAEAAARKLQAHIRTVTDQLLAIGVDITSKPWIVTEFGVGKREWSTFGKICDDNRKGEIIRAIYERCVNQVEAMYDYKAINSNAGEDNTNGTQLHQGKLASTGQWTKSAFHYCQATGNDISKSAPPAGSWPAGYYVDATGKTTLPDGTPGQE